MMMLIGGCDMHRPRVPAAAGAAMGAGVRSATSTGSRRCNADRLAALLSAQPGGKRDPDT